MIDPIVIMPSCNENYSVEKVSGNGNSIKSITT